MARKATSRSRGIASTVETQKRGFGGLIFSSPVISATASLPTRSTHLVVDLARQQPQRQPDHAGRMRQHALDGEMGLAGIGRAQHGRDAGAARSRCSGRLRGKRDGHYASGLAAKPSSRPRPRRFCITMRRRTCARLSIRTSLERNAPESLTRGAFRFVHGDIWQASPARLQDRVEAPLRFSSLRFRRFKSLIASVDRDVTQQSASADGHCVFGPLPARGASAAPRRIGWPRARPGRTASVPGRGTAPARACRRSAPARPRCRAAWPGI